MGVRPSVNMAVTVRGAVDERSESTELHGLQTCRRVPRTPVNTHDTPDVRDLLGAGLPHPGDGLRLLGAIVSTLSPDELLPSLDAALDLLAEGLAADAAEVFLVAPGGEDVILASCRGADRDRLATRLRFKTGQGYPGIVVARGTPVFSMNLGSDRRFLRRAVSERLASFVSVPLPGPEGPIGSLDLGWRAGRVPLETHMDALAGVSRAISMSVRAGFGTLRGNVRRAALAKSSNVVLACLDAIYRGSRAARVTIVLAREGRIHSTARSAPPFSVEGVMRCPKLRRGRGEFLVRPCARCDAPQIPGTARCCLPLFSTGDLEGAVVLDYDTVPPVPHTAELIPLLEMASEAASRIDMTSARRSGGTATGLDIRCLGSFEIRLNGKLVSARDFPRRKAVALLKLLVLKAGNPVSRYALVEHLWPGVSEGAGVNRLHGVVHALRSVIEPFGATKRWIYVRHEGEFYYFNTESPNRIDLNLFRSCISNASRTDDPAAALDELERASSLYRGDLFEDDPYEEWCSAQREQLRCAYLDGTRRLAALCMKVGQPQRATQEIRRALLLDPLCEELHGALIEALVAVGRRAEALQQYRACARLLREELGVEPLPSTQRLARLL